MNLSYSKQITATALLCVAICILIVSGQILLGWCKEGNTRVHTYNAEAVSNGYVLISPVVISQNNHNQGSVLLLDSSGKTVHTWKTKYPVMKAILRQDGMLYISMIRPHSFSNYPSFGTTGILQIIDWDSRTVWEYENENLTHDFDVLPNGSIVAISWDAVPQSFSTYIRGGYENASSTYWANSLLVIDVEGRKPTWVWHAYEHVSPSTYVLPDSLPKTDWMHLNSVQYVEHDPIRNSPAFLISARNISTLFLIDSKTGEIFWTSKNGLVSLQHDATLLESGNILVFDNGIFNPLTRGSTPLSRVVEINPNTQTIDWEYHGDDTPTGRTAFASSVMGGAQRLHNGNTLITLSTSGRILEVDAKGDAIWEYTLPFVDDHGDISAVFKARKYDKTNASWSKQIELNLGLQGFCRTIK